MEVRIGVVHTPKEILLEVDSSPDDLVKVINSAIKADDGMIWLTDTDGRKIGIPSERLAYIEMETGPDSKRVGFGPA